MNKKFVLVFCIFLSVGFLVHSQPEMDKEESFGIGMMGGLNSSTMHFPNRQSDQDQGVSSISGFGAGIVLDIKLSRNLSLRLEPMYLQKGCFVEEGANPFDQPEGEIELNSIEIPVLIRYTFGGRVQPYIVAGPALGINIKSRLSFDLTGVRFTADLKDVTETFDLGISAGAGVQIPLGGVKIFFEGKYSYGILNQRKTGVFNFRSNIIDIEGSSDREEDKFTNRGFQLMAGILFPL